MNKLINVTAARIAKGVEHCRYNCAVAHALAAAFNIKEQDMCNDVNISYDTGEKDGDVIIYIKNQRYFTMSGAAYRLMRKFDTTGKVRPFKFRLLPRK